MKKAILTVLSLILLLLPLTACGADSASTAADTPSQQRHQRQRQRKNQLQHQALKALHSQINSAHPKQFVPTPGVQAISHPPVIQTAAPLTQTNA